MHHTPHTIYQKLDSDLLDNERKAYLTLLSNNEQTASLLRDVLSDWSKQLQELIRVISPKIQALNEQKLNDLQQYGEESTNSEPAINHDNASCDNLGQQKLNSIFEQLDYYTSSASRLVKTNTILQQMFFSEHDSSLTNSPKLS